MPLTANISENVSYETRTSAKQCSQVLSDKQHGGKPVSGRVYDTWPGGSDHQVGSYKIMTMWPRQTPFTTGDIRITKQQVRYLTVIWLPKDQFSCYTPTRTLAEHIFLQKVVRMYPHSRDTVPKLLCLITLTSYAKYKLLEFCNLLPLLALETWDMTQR